MLVYFGYPTAHEDDARRAVRTGLEIVEAIRGQERQRPLHVRIGIHTGLVVVGDIGVGSRTEQLALGETPNAAARVQGVAEPDTVVMSAGTHRLVQGLFECQDLGPQSLKGLAAPVSVYRVIGEGAAQSRFEVAVRTGLTPLIGREEELRLLQRHWERAKAGEGHVVLLSGEAGIGKSRLVQELKEQVIKDDATRIEFRCSPYHQNSALYPVLEHLQRVLQFRREDAPQEKLRKLTEGARDRAPAPEAIPLLASLLSLPHPEGYPPLSLTPARQKQKTQEVLVGWLVAEAEQRAVYSAWEDIHWADPSTLELLTLFLEHVPAARLLAVLTFRPELIPPWGNRSYLSQMTLSRLDRSHVREIVARVAEGTRLPAEMVQQVIAKTDGVPLFVEELTKSVVESIAVHGRTPLHSLAIPTTLQDALMARLDRLSTVRDVAQLGATIGREFSYELIQAVSPLDESSLQQALAKLVETELLYRHGLPPQVRYVFKHALVQETAYHSLLRSTRQHYHHQIARVLEARFPDTTETQPELLAYHYTEATLVEQAIPYWQRAGERARQRSADIEAVKNFTQALDLLQTLSESPQRAHHELELQLALGAPLLTTRGCAAPEVEKVYLRAEELYRHVGDSAHLFPVLNGLWHFYEVRGWHLKAQEFAQQLLDLAHTRHDAAIFVTACYALGVTTFYLEELPTALHSLEQGFARYEVQLHRPLSLLTGQDTGVGSLLFIGHSLWSLGYADRALEKCYEAIALATRVDHPYSLAFALTNTAWRHQLRREAPAAQQQAEAAVALCQEHGFPLMGAQGTIWLGWALTEQGKLGEGLEKIQEGLAAWRATGAELAWPYFLTILAGAYRKQGQVEDGLRVLMQGVATAQRNNERWYEAELYRLRGELLLAQQEGKRLTEEAGQPVPSDTEAESCFQQAVAMARSRNAKSLELRASTSLARLWQQQGKQKEAHTLLSEVYHWFTEGFDTKDLQEAKGLLEELT